MRTFRLPIVILFALGLLLPLGARALDQGPAELDRLLARAERDWDGGHYVDALEACEEILNHEAGVRFVRPIALLTGELYRTVELTDDGRSPAVSPRGGYATYVTGSGQASRTHIVALEPEVSPAAELSGARSLVFAPSEGDAVYVAGGEITRVSLAGGQTAPVAAPGLQVRSAVFGADDHLYVVAGSEEQNDVYLLRRSGQRFAAPERLTETPGGKTGLVPAPLQGKLVYQSGNNVHVFDLQSRQARSYPANEAEVSADGSTLVLNRRQGGRSLYSVLRLADPGDPTQVFELDSAGQDLAVSPRGTLAAFRQRMPENDWSIFAFSTEDGALRRLSNEPQHDYSPHFLSENTLFSIRGEGRNRRSFYYDLRTGEEFELFRNNVIRVIEPQYEWVPAAGGTKIAFQADRTGDTIASERGVYVTDLTRPVTQEELLERVRTQLAAERDLRARGERMFAPIAGEVRQVTEAISRDRISRYLEALVGFGSRHITQPGNLQGVEYIAEQLRSFGYEPELQWFEPRGSRSANIVATLPGTVHPELVYVVGAHMDSVARAPGADDNGSGTTAVMEAARALKDYPQAATIVFVLFTAEESGLLGAREWVRRAVEDNVQVLGVMNNDMLGWTRHHRLDNTIRHTNAGLRDATHAAAFQFSRLITYDAFYFRGTDAAAFHSEYGGIITGIGAYPILSNPNYHQPSDTLGNVSIQLIAETSRTTAATMMLMASSPAQLKELQVASRDGNRAEIRWAASPERDIVNYTVVYGPANDPEANTETVEAPVVVLENAPAGTHVKVRANNQRGIHGWGWAELVVE